MLGYLYINHSNKVLHMQAISFPKGFPRSKSLIFEVSTLIRSLLKSDQPWSGLYWSPITLIRSLLESDHLWSGLHSGQINFWSGLWSRLITRADQALGQSESSLVNLMSDLNTLVSVQPRSRPITTLVSKFFEHFSAIWLVESLICRGDQNWTEAWSEVDLTWVETWSKLIRHLSTLLIKVDRTQLAELTDLSDLSKPSDVCELTEIRTNWAKWSNWTNWTKWSNWTNWNN